MCVFIKFSLNFSKAIKQSLSNKKDLSLLSKLLKGLAIFEKSLMNLRYKPACPRKLQMPLTLVGGGSVSITSIFALSTSIPLEDILWPRTIPSVTIKLHFSQFKTKLVCTHLFKTVSKFSKHKSKEAPKTEKSSIKTSIDRK